jgi:hypothetical protein
VSITRAPIVRVSISAAKFVTWKSPNAACDRYETRQAEIGR